jgi:NTP pyrophosphatase (non-canonical NTP hydrolase)
MNIFKNIRQWADDRDIIKGSTVQAQSIKLVEEFGEIAAGMNKNNSGLIMDGIGDCIVVATILAAQCGFNIEEHIADSAKDLPDDMIDGADIYKLVNGLAFITAFARMISNGGPSWKSENRALHFECVAFVNHLTALSEKLEIDIYDCLECSWNEIKDRKGKMVNGVFVKEQDLN